ncbi:MAG: peptide deformylase [Gemmatales bacterium]|nr:peptide deformylase [Gemmatales bacterium]MDW8388419.1 peptide deformylase [Gemmatales bacterium]
MKIVKYPHPALRHPAKPVSLIDAALRKIVAEMFQLMYEHHGLGLAAPQVALPYQVFVMNPTGDPEQREHEQVFINPELSDPKGLVEAEEGCLSFPDLYQKVRRAKEVRVQAYDAQGRLIDRVVTDLEARIVQHETDHLHGKLFIDYFSPGAKLSSRAILEAFEKEHRRAQERGELPSDAELIRQLQALEKEAIVVG